MIVTGERGSVEGRVRVRWRITTALATRLRCCQRQQKHQAAAGGDCTEGGCLHPSSNDPYETADSFESAGKTVRYTLRGRAKRGASDGGRT